MKNRDLQRSAYLRNRREWASCSLHGEPKQLIRLWYKTVRAKHNWEALL